MVTRADWVKGYARQAQADSQTFNLLQSLKVPECHKLQFLQMTCEKLVKAHLCSRDCDPADLQSSHAVVKKHLPVVLRQQVEFINVSGSKAQEVLKRVRHLAEEIDVLAPAVKRGGQRPDNCEYPWIDGTGKLRVPIDCTFHPSLLLEHNGRAILKLIWGAIEQLLK